MDVVDDVHDCFAFFVPFFSYIVSTEGIVSRPGEVVMIGPPPFSFFTLFSVSLLVTCHVITSCDYLCDLLFCHVHCL